MHIAYCVICVYMLMTIIVYVAIFSDDSMVIITQPTTSWISTKKGSHKKAVNVSVPVVGKWRIKRENFFGPFSANLVIVCPLYTI